MIRRWRLGMADHYKGAAELMSALKAAKNLASLRCSMQLLPEHCANGGVLAALWPFDGGISQSLTQRKDSLRTFKNGNTNTHGSVKQLISL